MELQSNLRLKSNSDPIFNLFEQTLLEAKYTWQAYNQAQIKIKHHDNLRPLLSSPISQEQKKCIFEILNLGGKEAVSDEVLVKFNLNLFEKYRALEHNANFNEIGVNFLKESVGNRQMTLIEELLKVVDLSSDDECTLECLLTIAESTPQILKLVLNKKKVRLQYKLKSNENLLNRLFKLALLHSDIDLFEKLLSLNIDPLKAGICKDIAINDRYFDYLCILLKQPNVLNISNKLLVNSLSARAFKNAKLIIERMPKKETFVHAAVVEKLMRAIERNDQMVIQLLDPLTAICTNPKVIWSAARSENEYLVQRFLAKEKKNIRDVLPLIAKFLDLLDFQDKDKSGLKFLFKLGANINELLIYDRQYAPRTLLTHLIGEFTLDIQNEMNESIKWLIDEGANPSIKDRNGVSAFELLVMFKDVQMINRMIGFCDRLSDDDKVRMLNDGFYKALVNNFMHICKEIYKSAMIKNKNFIQAQVHLTNLVINVGLDRKFLKNLCPFVSEEKLSFFQECQGLSTMPPLLECCWNLRSKSVAALRSQADYYNHNTVQKDNFGLLTYVALDPFIKGANFATGLIQDIAKDFANSKKELNVFYKDIISCYIILKSENIEIGSSLVKLLPWNRKVLYSYNDLEALQVQLKELVRNCVLHNKYPVSTAEKLQKKLDQGYLKMLRKTEDIYFFYVPEHVQEARRLIVLTQEQEKEAASINFREILDKMLSTSSLDENAKATITKFLNYVNMRVCLTGVPSGIPEELVKKSIACKNLEIRFREILHSFEYNKALGALVNKKMLETSDGIYRAFMPKLEKALAEFLSDITPHELERFVIAQQEKENFYLGIEEKLRIILYSYLLDAKIKSQADQKSLYSSSSSISFSSSSSSSSSFSSSSTEQLLPYEADSLRSLFRVILEAMELCGTKWGSDLQMLEQFALEKICLVRGNEIVATTQKPRMEIALHTELAGQRSSIIHQWARSWTERTIDELDDNEPPEVIEAELGNEIHYAYAASQHQGQFYGIPKAEKNVEFLVKWNREMNEDLAHFFNAKYTKPSQLIDMADDAINKRKQIDRDDTVEWMKEHLIGNWNKELFEAREKLIMESLNKMLDGLLPVYIKIISNEKNKKIELQEKVFSQIWSLLAKEDTILFFQFKNAISQAVIAGSPIETLKQNLQVIVSDASRVSRKHEFTSEIHDDKGKLVRREKIRGMMQKLNIIRLNAF